MSAVALNNRMTSDSNSDAVFASCTILPIHQTRLNAEEMAGLDGLGSLTDAIDKAIDYVSNVVDEVGDYVSEAATTASIAVFGGVTYHDLDPNPFGIPTPPPDTLTIITNYMYSCDKTIADLASGAICPCMPPP